MNYTPNILKDTQARCPWAYKGKCFCIKDLGCTDKESLTGSLWACKILNPGFPKIILRQLDMI